MAKFCSNCGAPLAPDSVFCEECGTRLEPPREIVIPPATDNNSVFMGFTPDNGAEIVFVRTRTMTEAAEIAASRNAQGKWSFWDSPGRYKNSAGDVRRYAEKEDRRLGKFSDRGGIQYYVVSPSGSVGQVFTDETDDDRPVLEWVYFAEGEGEDDLPAAPEQI